MADGDARFTGNLGGGASITEKGLQIGGKNGAVSRRVNFKGNGEFDVNVNVSNGVISGMASVSGRADDPFTGAVLGAIAGRDLSLDTRLGKLDGQVSVSLKGVYAQGEVLADGSVVETFSITSETTGR